MVHREHISATPERVCSAALIPHIMQSENKMNRRQQNMKRLQILLTAMALLCALTACGKTEAPDSSPQNAPTPQSNAQSPGSSSPSDDENTSDEDSSGEILVAYFSATGNTESIARHIQTALDADLYEIVPAEPYTDVDLNYSGDDCRANREQNDPNARPAISGSLENPENYSVVFLGYPIWWGQAPRIIDTFLESYDFSGVTIVPFCTSGSSGIDGSLDTLHALAADAQWLPGQRFSAGADASSVAVWVDGLDLQAFTGGDFTASMNRVA